MASLNAQGMGNLVRGGLALIQCAIVKSEFNPIAPRTAKTP